MAGMGIALAVIAVIGSSPMPEDRARVSPDAVETDGEGTVRVDVRDDAGHPLGAKITILGAGDTAGPYLAHGRGDVHAWGAVAYHRAYASHGFARLDLPPGRYDIWVSRGIEYTRSVALGVEVGGEPLLIEASLRRAVSLPGWTSADLHVHTGRSKDSVVKLEARVHQFIADGVDVIVATDHNRVTDLRPLVEELGLQDQLLAVPGEEMTTHYHGHFGVFPLEQHHAYENGGPIDTARAKVMFDRVRRHAPDAIIVANHPWMGMQGYPFGAFPGYFVRGELDPVSLTFGKKHHAFGFDAIELLNGYETPYPYVLDHHVEKWFTLLGAGLVTTATGGSDTHSLALNQGGYPRNYIDTGAVSVSDVTAIDITDALKHQRAFFTTGPLLELSAGGLGLGDLATRRADGTVGLAVRVSAAPWIGVDQVRVWVDGEVAQVWDLDRSSEAVRLDTELDVNIPHDTFVVLTAVGSTPLWPVAGEREWACRKLRRKKKRCGHLDVLPMAVTNPIFVDADGNGRYDAPRAP